MTSQIGQRLLGGEDVWTSTEASTRSMRGFLDSSPTAWLSSHASVHLGRGTTRAPTAARQIIMGEAPVGEDGTVIRSAEYVGSFPVDDRCLDEQMEELHRQLTALKACRRSRPVSLKFSIKGVKMYDEDETTLLMAHALRRVSLSTSRPSDAQFAFVSHNPGSADAQLYCHLFKARHARAAQFLNLLLCRCFQLYYMEKHPEDTQEFSSGSTPRRSLSLLNHGFPLSVSALVSFRRAPFLGLMFGSKKPKSSGEQQLGSQDEVFPTSSPSLVRKKAIRSKGMRSGAYRSFTFTPLKQCTVQERLSAAQEKDQDSTPARRSRAPSLAETEEALAQAVWCWAGIATDSSYSLLADDVLGSYLLCPHPKKPKAGSLIIRFPSGLITHLIANNRKGNFLLEEFALPSIPDPCLELSELQEIWRESEVQS
ncbi:SH2 domain-containing protein 5 isoform X3 [Nerophis ophidion]|uniref:SH2 domain-containing protein 5 isoform X3 n=1 Tax=Nerophis ophidion TaxID=159077 RepID=UPI002AE09202|nr:SH2 domain-containing protein 5 isoform X3 [Nerophis ophidion]